MEMAVPILPAADLAVAREFYVGKLGIEVAFESSNDDKTGLLGIRRGTMELTVIDPIGNTIFVMGPVT
jgi:catechol 2,3-dioxygenase-like lactoylglutathione lyase family enzyme